METKEKHRKELTSSGRFVSVHLWSTVVLIVGDRKDGAYHADTAENVQSADDQTESPEQ